MNTATGRIVDWVDVLKMRDEGDKTANFYKPVPNSLHPLLQGMNRAQRREYYRKNKYLFKKEDL